MKDKISWSIVESIIISMLGKGKASLGYALLISLKSVQHLISPLGLSIGIMLDIHE